MVTGQLFSGDDTLSEKFFRATSDRVVARRPGHEVSIHVRHACHLACSTRHRTGGATSTTRSALLRRRTEKVMCLCSMQSSMYLLRPIRWPDSLRTLTGTRRRSSFMSPSRSGAMRSSGPAAKGTFDDLSASRERGPDFVPVGPPNTTHRRDRTVF